MLDIRINVTIWEYKDAQNWLFACLEVGKMEKNYHAITLYVSSTNISCFYFYWWNAGHDDTLLINHSINLIFILNRSLSINRCSPIANTSTQVNSTQLEIMDAGVNYCGCSLAYLFREIQNGDDLLGYSDFVSYGFSWETSKDPKKGGIWYVYGLY